MTEILNVTMTTQDQSDPRPQYFVKICKDGSVLECSIVPKGKEELDQCTMELEYIPQPPTDEEKLAYALTLPEVAGLPVSGELKTQIAQEMILKPDFVMPAFDPNFSRVNGDPDYFFKTPCKPVIWCWTRGDTFKFITVDATDEEKAAIELENIVINESNKQKAVVVAKAFLDERLKPLKNGKSKWDMTIDVYKQQYNLVEV